MRPPVACAALLAIVNPSGVLGQTLMTTPIGFRSGYTEGAVTVIVHDLLQTRA